MNFFKKVFSGLKSFKKNFFTVNQTELTGLSKQLMILFFLTSLWLIAAGISSSVSQTTSPLKMSVQVFAFLIPVWLLFYYLYKFLSKREKHIFAQLSYYVTIATMLHGLVELVELVYNVIPKVFLGKLIEFFTSHNMLIVLNILGVLFFLALFGIIIHGIQHNNEKKKIFKDRKVLNVKRESCFNCGTKRSHDDNFCAFCGEGLKRACVKCEKEIYKYTLFCNDCGEKQG